VLADSYVIWVKNPKLIQAVTIILAVALLMQNLFGFAGYIKASEITAGRSNNVAYGDKSLNIQNINRLKWFGGIPDKAVVSDLSTAVQLELKGISKSGQSQLAGAFIAEKGKPESYYRIGDALPAGAGVLQSVYDDHVIVRNGELLGELKFDPVRPDELAPISPASR
jgi:type II secretory pathway component PulC